MSNLLRLLEAAPEVCEMVAQHSLEMGHARALLGLTNKRKQAEVAAEVAKKGMSVRDTEALVRRLTSAPSGGSSGSELGGRVRPQAAGSSDPNVSRLEQELAEKLGREGHDPARRVRQGQSRRDVQQSRRARRHPRTFNSAFRLANGSEARLSGRHAEPSGNGTCKSQPITATVKIFCSRALCDVEFQNAHLYNPGLRAALPK